MNRKAEEKQKLIREMLALQKQFGDYDRKHGVSPEDYFVGGEDHPLHGYRKKFSELAARVVDLAHEQKGSHR